MTYSEEVAFNDPPAGMAEQMILNGHLSRLLRHSRLTALQQFVQQVLDGYFVKVRPAKYPGVGDCWLCQQRQHKVVMPQDPSAAPPISWPPCRRRQRRRPDALF